jgi:hypothetical protein
MTVDFFGRAAERCARECDDVVITGLGRAMIARSLSCWGEAARLSS